MKTEASIAGYAQTDDTVFAAMKEPSRNYFRILWVLALGCGGLVTIWIHQVLTGMGVAGITHPVGWGVYIANFVFWVGIAHSGTLISAILHLVRSKWRNAVSRSAEAMTVFAVMTAGLFPLIHLGRVWVLYYILPYPSERQLWPNFISPLVWDVFAVSTYFTVSLIFFYVGLIPDLASARDQYELSHGPDHPQTLIYRTLALGWTGASSQWRHYSRGYLYFAAMATPLVVSVHSIVSWDFGMSLLPGWHSTIFPPYFVAGAIHSGIAMVLTLIIPMRRLLKLEKIITKFHLESMAQTMLVTTMIVAYAYILEPLVAWYSGIVFEQKFYWWILTGNLAIIYWSLPVLNVLVPLLFLFRKIRRSIPALFIISILVNIGMWLERYLIVTGATSHDFLPHNWGSYSISWVEIGITIGSFCFFFFLFLIFSRILPVAPTSELKEEILGNHHEGSQELPEQVKNYSRIAYARSGVLGVFSHPDALMEALRSFKKSGFNRMETFSPVKIGEISRVLGMRHGPVRFWTLSGALLGCVSGFALAIGTASVNDLIVGGKTAVSIIPYCTIAFEGTVLFGSIFTLVGLIYHARLARWKGLPPSYDRRFSRDRFGLLVECDENEYENVTRKMNEVRAEEVRTLE